MGEPLTPGEIRDINERYAPEPLTKDEVRQLLRECVTVVKPGEVLVIRMATDVPREQALEYQVTLGDFLASHAPGVKVAIVCGDELGVAQAGGTVVRHEVAPLTDAALAEQLRRVMTRERRINPGAFRA